MGYENETFGRRNAVEQFFSLLKYKKFYNRFEKIKFRSTLSWMKSFALLYNLPIKIQYPDSLFFKLSSSLPELVLSGNPFSLCNLGLAGSDLDIESKISVVEPEPAFHSIYYRSEIRATAIGFLERCYVIEQDVADLFVLKRQQVLGS